MKYQQLENLESGWKLDYLLKKHRDGEEITRYQDPVVVTETIQALTLLEREPIKVQQWIELHIHPDLDNRLKQSIRARRKRHFDAEHQHTRKKSIDLEFMVWQRLAALAQHRKITLSETIIQLLEDAERKEQYASQMHLLKRDLQDILAKKE